MLETELLQIIGNGENSGIEFKSHSSNLRTEQIAKEIVAFANFQGGKILLGVEDDKRITGLQKEGTEEWVMNILRDKVHPQITPYYEEVHTQDNKIIAIVHVENCLFKPYVLCHNGREDIYIRKGSHSQLATREEQQRLYQSGGLLHSETFPIHGTTIEDIDIDRVSFYLRNIMQDLSIPQSQEKWGERLYGLGLMAKDSHDNYVCSVAGLLCFGIYPRSKLRHAGVRIMSFSSTKLEYKADLDTIIDAPFIARYNSAKTEKEVIDQGLIGKITDVLLPLISEEATQIDENMQKNRIWFYPWEAIREALINAIVHRDWTRSLEVEIKNFTDRIEIQSPGNLQNSMTLEKMLAGQRSPRNTVIVDIMRNFGYVDARGMGVRTKIVPLMKEQNQREPIFEITEDYVKVILYKKSE